MGRLILLKSWAFLVVDQEEESGVTMPAGHVIAGIVIAVAAAAVAVYTAFELSKSKRRENPHGYGHSKSSTG